MKKTFKILLSLSMVLALLIIPKNKVEAALKDGVTPYAGQYRMQVDEDYSYVDATVIDPGNRIEIFYRIYGSYLITNNGGVYSVSDVNLYVTIEGVKINGADTGLIVAKIASINRTNNSRSVTISFTLQYKNSGSAVYKDLERITKTV